MAALEDKIVQRAVADVLNAIYEEDFLGFSYGFRPGRGAHDALDALSAAIYARKVNYIVDVDIAKFFDSVSKEWLARSFEHRIGDKRVLHLIQKWLRAGVLEDGRIEVPERGTGQGAAISPLLANVYLHYVLDLWAERWRRREAKGGHCQTKLNTAYLGAETRSSFTVFAHELLQRSARFEAENCLYLFALTVPVMRIERSVLPSRAASASIVSLESVVSSSNHL